MLQSGPMKSRKLTAVQIREALRKIHFARLLGVRLARIHRNGITVECRIRKCLLNSAGNLHGGIGATLADVAVGAGLHWYLGNYRPITTVELKINYFRPVSGGRILARSRLLRVGSTLCVGRVDLMDGQFRMLGAALVTYMRLGGPGEKSS